MGVGMLVKADQLAYALDRLTDENQGKPDALQVLDELRTWLFSATALDPNAISEYEYYSACKGGDDAAGI